MSQIVKTRIQESIDVKVSLLADESIINFIAEISDKVIHALKNGNKVMFAGNGGSCSDAFHLAGELVSRFMFDRRPLPAIALGGNNSILTAIGNDYSYNDVFSREIIALGNKGDVLIAISTSGNSANIINAIETAKEEGILAFGLTGKTGGKMNDLCPCLNVPSSVTPRIQEAHVLIGHIICEIVEEKIFRG